VNRPNSKSNLASRSPTSASRPAASEPEVVLIAAVGMVPAVVTETVWALATQSGVVPDRVIVLTTSQGKEGIEAQLQKPQREFGGQPVWDALRDAVSKRFAPGRDVLKLEVRLLEYTRKGGGSAEPIDDPRTAEQHDFMADTILKEVFLQTYEKNVRVIASISGGRKTMGALLYGAMTFVGRNRVDQVLHVLVKSPYDEAAMTPRFYFNAQSRQDLSCGGKPYSAKKAQIELVDIPFVSMRTLFEREFKKPPASFRSLATLARDQMNPPPKPVNLELEEAQPIIHVNTVPLRLAPQPFLLLRFLATRARGGREAYVKYPLALADFREFALEIKKKLHSDTPNTDWRKSSTQNADDADVFTETRLRNILLELNKKLRGAGEPFGYLLALLPEPGRYSLRLTPEAIQFRK